MTHSIEFHQKFIYQKNKRGIFIPVTLISGEKTITSGAKLDTGADFCYFSREHAQELGLPLEQGVRLQVETNRPEQPLIFYGHEVRVRTLGYEIEATIYFWENYRLPRNLLGRAGWINKFKIGLVEHDVELYLSHHNE